MQARYVTLISQCPLGGERERLSLSFLIVLKERCLGIKQALPLSLFIPFSLEKVPPFIIFLLCIFFSLCPKREFCPPKYFRRKVSSMSSLLSGRPRREGIEQMWERNRSPCKSSFRESIKALEADIQHANSLASALPRNYCGGDTIQMRLCYSPFAPLFMFFMEWMDYSCTDIVPSYLGLLHILVNKVDQILTVPYIQPGFCNCMPSVMPITSCLQVYADGVPALCSKERKASLREFYAVIYPSLRILEGQISEIKETKMKSRCRGLEAERDEECGICMESQAKMVLPSCGHSMCINCFHDWNVRSQSCPYCRGSLKRVSSTDLWVLTGTSEVVDPETLAMDSLTRFYLYIESLPSLTHDTHVLLLDYMI